MNILVTGGDGQLATCLKKITYNTDNHYIFMSKKELDITNIDEIEEVFEKYNFELIINCAAYTNVDKAPEEIEKAYLINEIGPLNLTLCARHFGAKIIHISTDFVFDGEKNIPYKETDKTNPLSVYGASKLAGEKAILGFDNSMVIRTSWLYSEYGKNFFKTMFNLIMKRDKAYVVNDQIGTPTYAMDLARFIYFFVENSFDKFENKVFHFSNEGCCSWYDFAKAIEIFVKRCDIIGTMIDNSINPVSTYEYQKMSNKLLEIRPCYSVLSKNELKKIYEQPINHWLISLHNCIINYVLMKAYDEEFEEYNLNNN